MADQRCKRCGNAEDHMYHTDNPIVAWPTHPFEPEDAAPAPSELLAAMTTLTTGLPYFPNEAGARVAWPRVSPNEVRGYECEPVAQSGAGGATQSNVSWISGAFFDEQEWVLKSEAERRLKIAMGKPEPATGQVGAEQLARELILQQMGNPDLPDRKINLTITESVKACLAYAAHVTKGLQARLAELLLNTPDKYCAKHKYSILAHGKPCPRCEQLEAAEARNLELMGELERAKRMVFVAENAFKLQNAVDIPGKTGEMNCLQIAKAWLALELRAESAEKRLAEAEKALRNMLASAKPNEKDHPTMWKAWSEARAALTPEEGK